MAKARTAPTTAPTTAPATAPAHELKRPRTAPIARVINVATDAFGGGTDSSGPTHAVPEGESAFGPAASGSSASPAHSLDTDLGNYNLHDILQLFKLPTDFTEVDMKRARRTTMRTHPDASGLPPEYFRFFSAAYRMLEQIFECRHPKRWEQLNRTDTPIVYEVEKDPEKELLLRDITKKDDFHSWFNEAFQKMGYTDEESARGYEGWLRSNDGVEAEAPRIAQNQMDAFFEKRKAAAARENALVQYDGVLEFNQGAVGHELDRSGATTQHYSFASGVFDKLQYDDLKRAHTETVIPISTEAELHRRPQFSSVEDYTSFRNRQNVMALTEDETRDQMLRLATRNSELETQRAFNLIKQDDYARKKQDEWWSGIRALKHR